MYACSTTRRDSVSIVLVFHFDLWFRQDPEIKPLVAQEEETLQRMFPEIPLWIKSPDFDRVTELLNCFDCLFFSGH